MSNAFRIATGRITRTTRRHEWSDSELAQMMFGFDIYAEVRGEDNRVGHEALLAAIREPIAAFRAEGELWRLYVAAEEAAEAAVVRMMDDPQVVAEWSAARSVMASLEHTELPDARQRSDTAAREFRALRDGYAIEYDR